MKQNSRVWIALLGLAMLIISAAPASAFPYTSGWQIFTTAVDVIAPYAPTQPQYGGMMGDWYNDYIDNDPYTFHLYSPGVLKVTDVFETGDRFKVWDIGGATTFNGLLGTSSSSTWVSGGTETDPGAAYDSNPTGLPGERYSTFTYLLGAGDHALVFQNCAFKSGEPKADGQEGIADAYFRVDPVPEPGTIALFGLGLAVAGTAIRRKR